MDPIPVPAYADEQHVIKEMIGRFDAPAFIRRARRVEESYQHLLAKLDRERTQKLEMVRLRLGQLRALAGSWSALEPWFPDAAELTALQSLHDLLRPVLRLPPEPTTSWRILRGALVELTEAMAIFNRRWQKVLAQTDLTPVNAEREGYNRYYLLERECALGAARASREKFRPLESLTPTEIAERFPLLALPRWVER